MNQGCPSPWSEEAEEGLRLSLDAALVVSWAMLSWLSLCRLLTLHRPGILCYAGVIGHQIQHCSQIRDEHHKK